MFILWIKIYFSDGARRHVGASLINLEETLWEQWGYMHWVKVYVEKEKKSTWGGDTCRKHGFYQAHQWKKRKVYVNLNQPSLIHGQVTWDKQILLLRFVHQFCMVWLSHKWRKQLKVKRIWLVIMSILIHGHPNMSHTALKISHPNLKEPLCHKSLSMFLWLLKDNSVFRWRNSYCWKKKFADRWGAFLLEKRPRKD